MSYESTVSLGLAAQNTMTTRSIALLQLAIDILKCVMMSCRTVKARGAYLSSPRDHHPWSCSDQPVVLPRTHRTPCAATWPSLKSSTYEYTRIFRSSDVVLVAHEPQHFQPLSNIDQTLPPWYTRMSGTQVTPVRQIHTIDASINGGLNAPLYRDISLSGTAI